MWSWASSDSRYSANWKEDVEEEEEKRRKSEKVSTKTLFSENFPAAGGVAGGLTDGLIGSPRGVLFSTNISSVDEYRRMFLKTPSKRSGDATRISGEGKCDRPEK